ncbi:MAG: amino acid ABC transporter permease [Anaerolineae bacterium]|jgi:general L-amino acid transport system permease protein|nr:amino acid ABC transporter permease [Anaerolineae bacterium]MBT7070854.1 amino acid ABC transporter permease [Anaerolineae bacterium]MBT7324358.1 amino acid ABC transporter permease [Anaerolineae bacterium]
MTTSTTEVLAPPTERYTVLGWLRRNLFGSIGDSILTIIAIWLTYAMLKPSLSWGFSVAKWTVIADNLKLFMVGRYPAEELWRVWVVLYLLAAVVGFTWGAWVKGKEKAGYVLLGIPVFLALLPFSPTIRMMILALDLFGFLGIILGRRDNPKFKNWSIISLLLYFPVGILLIGGLTGETGFLPTVKPDLWGGLMLTILLAVIGIIFSFPIGVALALGRQSKLPIISWFSVGVIELVRGVPLITILFMMDLMLPLFLPAEIRVEGVIRAFVAITLFSAAYMAENVRGGLQAIPRGQYEAAHALGLNGFTTMAFIILPQALKAVIPILVSQFIGLLKDTTLVMILSLFDVLGIGKSVLGNPEYVGTAKEVYVFVAALFWVLSYGLSYASQRLETSLGVGER